MDFEDEVLELVSEIPKRKVTTYKKIAVALGRPKAHRAVGNALSKNPNPVDVPCHRVVRSNGEIGNYSRGVKEKKKLLEAEGVDVTEGEIDLDKYMFDDF